MCKVATDVDRHVGHRIRAARLARRVSQEKLAELLGITFQQVQKYEKATNRISAGRLAVVAEALDLPVAWFFAGAPLVVALPSVAPVQHTSAPQ